MFGHWKILRDRRIRKFYSDALCKQFKVFFSAHSGRPHIILDYVDEYLFVGWDYHRPQAPILCVGSMAGFLSI